MKLMKVCCLISIWGGAQGDRYRIRTSPLIVVVLCADTSVAALENPPEDAFGRYAPFNSFSVVTLLN
jgi:hypothetical protein